MQSIRYKTRATQQPQSPNPEELSAKLLAFGHLSLSLKNLAAVKNNALWSLSRLVLLELLMEVKPCSDFFVSIAHTSAHTSSLGGSNGAMAALSFTGPVGVDIEWMSRPIATNSVERVSNSDELTLGLCNHQLWTIKEASFKAKNQANDVISRYKVISWDPQTTMAKVRHEMHGDFEARTFIENGLCCALAKPL